MTSDPTPADPSATPTAPTAIDRSGKIASTFDRPFDGFNELHVDFCHALAQDFKRTTRYVAFSPRNKNTHSIEYVRLLLDTCSEIEALAKLLCNKHPDCPLKKRPTINDWRTIIIDKYPHFSGVQIAVFNGHIFQPWKKWGETPPTNPGWWDAYNKVKHDRTVNFRRANLRNVVLAVCGLMAFAAKLYHHHYHSHEQPWFLKV